MYYISESCEKNHSTWTLFANPNILSVPIVLVFIVLMGLYCQERERERKKKKKKKRERERERERNRGNQDRKELRETFTMTQKLEKGQKN